MNNNEWITIGLDYKSYSYSSIHQLRLINSKLYGCVCVCKYQLTAVTTNYEITCFLIFSIYHFPFIKQQRDTEITIRKCVEVGTPVLRLRS